MKPHKPLTAFWTELCEYTMPRKAHDWTLELDKSDLLSLKVLGKKLYVRKVYAEKWDFFCKPRRPPVLRFGMVISVLLVKLKLPLTHRIFF